MLALELLLLFASAYVLPMVMSDAEQKLPPCCRRDGKHHCSMMDKIPQSGGAGFHVLRTKCQCWPAGLVEMATNATRGERIGTVGDASADDRDCDHQHCVAIAVPGQFGVAYRGSRPVRMALSRVNV